MPTHGFCVPEQAFCTPTHAFCMPDHDFCMPRHEFVCQIMISACQNAILHAETRLCMSKHGRSPRWSQPGLRRAPAGARWPHGGAEDVNGELGQHTKRLWFTSPGGTREPAGPVVPPVDFPLISHWSSLNLHSFPLNTH